MILKMFIERKRDITSKWLEQDTKCATKRDHGELFIRFGHASIPYKLHKAEENKFFLIETGFEVLFYEEDGTTKKLVVVIQAGFDRSFNKFE